MYQPKFEAFDASQPLLSGISSITVGEALTCEQILITFEEAPSAEISGETLLVSTDFRRVKNAHLDGSRVRFLDVPAGEDAMRMRIDWMWHAGSRSPDFDLRCRARMAIGMMVDHVGPEGDFELQALACDLAAIAEQYPTIPATLFTGDLDDVPDLIDAAVQNGADETELVRAAAWMIVTWGALEQQREACQGHRLIHYPLDGIWGADGSQSWTIGQLFRPQTKRHKFAHEIMGLYHANRAAGVEKVGDKRTLNRIERTLSKMNLAGINRANEQEILALFGQGRMASIPARMEVTSEYADAFQRQYEAILAGPDGKGAAGQRADLLTARISAVHRTAIVCARVFRLAAMAAEAKWSDDLRAMLDTHLPDVLRLNTDRQPDHNKFRLRQLFHVVRVEFLRDGEHVPKSAKGAPKFDPILVELELGEERRRGHEIFDRCWVELNHQPSDWRFVTSFGWQCDGEPPVRLSAPAGACPPPATYPPEAIYQFLEEQEHAAAKQRDAVNRVPFAVVSGTTRASKRVEL